MSWSTCKPVALLMDMMGMCLGFVRDSLLSDVFVSLNKWHIQRAELMAQIEIVWVSWRTS